MSHPYLLDTNTVSYVVSGASSAARSQLLRLDGKSAVYVSAISEAELRFGIAKGPKHATRIAMMERFLMKAIVQPWGHEAAVAYGELRARLQAVGSPLGALDTLIAAHALALGAVLVSHDKAFHKLHKAGLDRELQVVDWATDL
ncbi:MAG TPA: PIN domain-containing protein, partial [Acidobacteriaceae bacterium]